MHPNSRRWASLKTAQQLSLVIEMYDFDLQRDQERRQRQADEQAAEWGFDSVELREIVKRHGAKQVLRELATIEPNLIWSIPSDSYLSGAYDDPNPGHDEF